VVALLLATPHEAAAQELTEAVVAGPTDASVEAPIGVAAGVSDSIARLYLSALGRPADAEGLDYWVDQYVNGVALERIAAEFMTSAEWQRRMGELDDSQFVDLLYRNVLERSPDVEGRHYWLDQAAGGLTRTDMLVWFSEGEEFVRRTGTAAPQAPPFPALPPDSGSGRRIVYSDSQQRVWIVNDDGRLHDSYLVSGRDGVPSAGTYSVYSKSETAWAGHDGITMNHMVRFAWGRRLSIGFHSIPRYGNGAPMQTEDELGTPQSAGCVRQADHQAEALYHWARVGDVVVVTP
jgi:lipoprotein-anchoring transpeptidase ErfK/SrfK